MDNISRKRNFENIDKEYDLSRKKVRLTRSPSFGKRIALSSDREEGTSREGKNIVYKDATNITETDIELISIKEVNNAFIDKAYHDMIKLYYKEKSVAEDIQNHKFYDLLPDELKQLHESVYQLHEWMHTCYMDQSIEGKAFDSFVENFAGINKKLKDWLKAYESDKVVLLEKLVEQLEERDKQLEKQDENAISGGEPEKWKEIYNIYWNMREQKMSITLPLTKPLGMGRELGGPSDQQGQGRYLKREEYLKKERQRREQQKQELISYYGEFYQKFQKSKLLPDAQELAKDAKGLNEEIKGLLDEHRTQWENMVRRLELQRQNISPDIAERLELPKQKISPNMVERLELLRQKTSLIQDKWEKRETQYQVKNIEGDNRLWSYVRDKMSKELSDQIYEIRKLNHVFEKVKKNEVGDAIPDIASKVHDLLRRSKDIEDNIGLRLSMLTTNGELKDGFIKKYRELIKHFNENARYFGFLSD